MKALSVFIIIFTFSSLNNTKIKARPQTLDKQQLNKQAFIQNKVFTKLLTYNYPINKFLNTIKNGL